MVRTDILSLLLCVVPLLIESTTTDCVSARGALGGWLKDHENGAHDQQYAMPLHHILGRTDERYHELVSTQGQTFQGGAQHRSATQYHWLDESSACQIEYVEQQELCQLTEQLGVARFFFLGDSLTQEQAISLWMLMKAPEPTNLVDNSRFERSIQCSPSHTLHIVFIHNEELLETPEPVSMSAKKGNCCPDRSCYCYPWFHEYSSFDGRTIVVANPGHSLTTPQRYSEALGHFVHLLKDSHRGEEDFVFLRTSVPGHVQCDIPNLHPYPNILGFTYTDRQYEKEKAELPSYNLTLTCEFNHILLTMADEFHLQVLDIFPMTILRRDGHLSEDPSYRGQGVPANDCVQYSLPGPVDWWNHLMYSNLKDLADREASSSKAGAQG